MGLDPTPRLVIVSEDEVVFCCLDCPDWPKGVVGSIGGHENHLRHRFGIPKAWDTKTHGSQKASAEAKGSETLDFTGFQAQKKTSVDVFS
ncbi:hypothetical protein [Pseudomonas rhodesiae]|jgi:hypothetical protein|uniref:hypothetical protein n=1 Tax=Pseudomonas rhodesiae TaxID=76760 RepID=UPI00241CB865|nr:hypothetical protein [Pseudomonas rhodesiae]